MCGIIGCALRSETAQNVLLQGLSNLEYRGYDSAGIATLSERLAVEKRVGDLTNLTSALAETTMDGTIGIGHTRWSTHGPPTKHNAHPHTDCHENVAVVHNGIIDNHRALKEELTAAGHQFTSETDTEVIPHLIESARADGATCKESVREAVNRLDGSYAIVVLFAETNELYCVRRDSPLVLGIGETATYLASDVPAFLEFTNQVVYLEDGEMARITADDWQVLSPSGERLDPTVETVDWSPKEIKKDGYDHFMLKEIHEQPRALEQCLQGRLDEFEDGRHREELT